MLKPIVLVSLLLFGFVAFQSVASGEVHTGERHDCVLSDFPNQKAAQDHYRENPTDPDRLDQDDDRIACNGSNELSDICPCDFNPVPRPSNTPVPSPTQTPTPSGGGGGTGALCHSNCIPHSSPHGLNPSPGFNRPVVMTLLVPKTMISCGAETVVTARVVYPDGVGAPNRLVTFQSTLGTVYSNLLTDYGGYVQTKFVAPLSPAIVTIDAFADGLRQSVQMKVDCPQPVSPIPAASLTKSPAFSPPRTGDGGLR